MRETIDLAVIGAGPCGISVGAAAAGTGRSTVLFDRGPLTASLLNYPWYMTFFSTAEKLEVGGVPFTIPEPRPTRREALAYYRRVVRHHGIEVRQGHEVTAITREGEGFRLEIVRRDGQRFEVGARAVVVATGGFQGPNALGVEGEELPKVHHYYQEPYPFTDQDVLVVGGGNSAVEAALEMYRNDVRVQLVHFTDTIDRGVKPWVVPDITNRIEKGEIPVHWRHRVARIGWTEVVLRDVDTGVERVVPNDAVVAMTGWRADPHLLRSLGVPIDAATGVPAHDPETMETDVAGVYIAGVIAAGHDANRIFIENGREHGGRILRALGAELPGA